MPQKRSHRLKSHRDLQQIAEHNPDSEQIFEESLVDSHYPSRPEMTLWPGLIGRVGTKRGGESTEG